MNQPDDQLRYAVAGRSLASKDECARRDKPRQGFIRAFSPRRSMDAVSWGGESTLFDLWPLLTGDSNPLMLTRSRPSYLGEANSVVRVVNRFIEM